MNKSADVSKISIWYSSLIKSRYKKIFIREKIRNFACLLIWWHLLSTYWMLCKFTTDTYFHRIKFSRVDILKCTRYLQDGAKVESFCPEGLFPLFFVCFIVSHLIITDCDMSFKELIITLFNYFTKLGTISRVMFLFLFFVTPKFPVNRYSKLYRSNFSLLFSQ